MQTRLVLNLANAARDPKLSPAVGSEISARLAALPAKLKGVNRKSRLTVYYLLAEHFNKLDLFK